jgi:DNA-binding MarR family transcriptional regulator
MSAGVGPAAGRDAPAQPGEGADEIIHQPLRLRIMAVLNSLPAREPLDFTQLRASVNATDGNLGAHLSTLERAGYVEIQKDFVGKRPRTRVCISRAGRSAFARHVAYLRGVLDLAGAAGG